MKTGCHGNLHHFTLHINLVGEMSPYMVTSFGKKIDTSSGTQFDNESKDLKCG